MTGKMVSGVRCQGKMTDDRGQRTDFLNSECGSRKKGIEQMSPLLIYPKMQALPYYQLISAGAIVPQGSGDMCIRTMLNMTFSR
jgi:hypothetical protein